MRKDIALDQKGPQPRGRDEATVAFAITYKGGNPQQVAQVANTLASFYIDENLKLREQQATGTADFLRAQLDEMKQRLEEQEQRLSQFKERAMGELPEQLQANIAVLERLNTQLRLNGEKRARTVEQRAALAQQLAELEGLRPPSKMTPATVATAAMAVSSRPDANVAQLEKLQQELAALQARYSEKYPDIGRVKSEIAALEQQIVEAENTKRPGQVVDPLLNPYLQQLKKEFGALDAEIKALHTEEQAVLQSIALYQQRVENTPRRDQELQRLQRDYDTAKELYQSLLKRQEEAKLAEQLEQRQKGEQFRLLEPAVPAAQPAEPDRRKNILMGLFFSLGLAAGIVILAEQLDSSFHTVDDLYAFAQVSVLARLPCIVTRADRRRKRWRALWVTLSTILGLVLIVGSLYVAIKGPASLTELYAQLQRS
jgi:polysaccharide chain length determinant protein (PEP-CTERM system associated)